MIKNIFDQHVSDELIQRIEQLSSATQPSWGKMSVDQMLAHCNVAFSYTYEPETFKKPSAVKKFLLKTFIKKMVVSEKPYPKNGRTASEFLMKTTKNFEKEKEKLAANIRKTQSLGPTFFEGRDNFSFGKMSSKEWNNLLYKHLDHHLIQFGV